MIFFSNNWQAIACLALAVLWSASGAVWASHPQHSRPLVLESLETLVPPTAAGAHDPALAWSRGKLFLSWSQPAAAGHEFRVAIFEAGRWSAPRTIVRGADLFMNWADTPGIAVFPDTTLAAYWLRKVGPLGYAYSIEVALSRDDGLKWSPPIIPHDDQSVVQHGFVSAVPSDGGGLTLVWLDGRAYGHSPGGSAPDGLPDSMQLRATQLDSDGTLGRDTAIDLRTCSCCQTSLATTEDGAVLVAYRDRTDTEVRDISVARLENGFWQDPISVHDDGWEIDGCPVNGPAISTFRDNAVVVWFTAAGERPAVKVAFSHDGGRSFGDVTEIGLGEPTGRVDVEMLDEDTAVATWVEWHGDGEAIMICRVQRGVGCDAIQALTTNRDSASVNFPKILRAGNDLYIAWTQPKNGTETVTLLRGGLRN